jgi:putative ABC transport system permease protein
MMLGARARDVRLLVLHQALVDIALGTILGLGGALLAGTVLAAFLVRVTPRDPATLALVSMILLAVSAVACLVPARRAVRLNPVDALRQP